MRHWAGPGWGALLALALLATATARAEPSAGPQPLEAVIEIEQAPGSEACPDKEVVFRSIQHLFPDREFRLASDGSQSTVRARVRIRPLRPGHEAVLTLLPPHRGERVIQAPDEDCRGLADALALAFVMLVAPPNTPPEAASADEASTPEAAATPASSALPGAPAPKPSEEQNSPRAPLREPARSHSVRSYRAGVGASLVGGLDMLSKPALGAAGELELFHRRGWGLSVQGLRLWSLPAEAEGGSVTLTLWALLIGPCYRQPLAAKSQLDACLNFGIGSQHANAQGFLAADSRNFPWQVLIPSISYRQGSSELLSGFVRVGFVAQLRPQSFSVERADGSGEKVEIASAPTFGVMTEIGLMFGSGLF